MARSHCRTLTQIHRVFRPPHGSTTTVMFSLRRGGRGDPKIFFLNFFFFRCHFRGGGGGGPPIFFLNFFFFSKRRGARMVRLLRSRGRTVLYVESLNCTDSDHYIGNPSPNLSLAMRTSHYGKTEQISSLLQTTRKMHLHTVNFSGKLQMTH